MKLFYIPALFLLLSACNEKNKTDYIKKSPVSVSKPVSPEKIAEPLPTEFKSDIRPDEKLDLDKIYSDTAEFVEFSDGGDYSYLVIKKGKKTIALTTNDSNPDFVRGDIFDVKWKIDSIYIAGDGERLDYTEWFVGAKKIKEGSVSLFRKKYKKPIKYHWATDAEYTTEYKDYLYTLVEYYLANSDKDLVKSHLTDSNEELSYSIEEGEKDGRSYVILGLATEFEHRTSIIQWLYLDNENRKLYEYDLANDKLIEFN